MSRGEEAGRRPDTAHPSLWRQGKLVARHGLFELAEGVYQVRGLDLSNMSLVETDNGVITVPIPTSCSRRTTGRHGEPAGSPPS